MAKEPPSNRHAARSGRFWANVILITLAHIALIAGLIRWSAAAKAPSNPESIVWLGGAGDLARDEAQEEEPSSPEQRSTKAEPSPPEKNEDADEKPLVRTARSEIELPSATPKPTPTARPAKSTPTPAAKPKTTPRPIPKSTPRKRLMVTASPKPVTKPKPSPARATVKSERKDKITLAKSDSAPQNGSGSAGKGGTAGGGSSASEFGWYGDMLHDRFYSAWIQPTTNVPSGTKFSTLVSVRIEKDGRVSRFEIAKPSGNATVNESVAAVAKQVGHVDPPPARLINGDRYDVKINFELNTEDNPGN
jgi:TonB family protein